MKRTALGSVVGVTALLILSTPNCQAGVILFPTDDRIAQVTDVTVAGTSFDGTYDFTFHHGISYNQLESNLGTASPILWTDITELRNVLETIAVQVRAFGSVSGRRTDDIYVPRLVNLPLGVVGANLGSNQYADNYAEWYTLQALGGRRLNDALLSNDAWVTASPSISAAAVPEPPSLIVFGLIAFFGGLSRRTRVCH